MYICNHCTHIWNTENRQPFCSRFRRVFISLSSTHQNTKNFNLLFLIFNEVCNFELVPMRTFDPKVERNNYTSFSVVNLGPLKEWVAAFIKKTCPQHSFIFCKSKHCLSRDGLSKLRYNIHTHDNTQYTSSHREYTIFLFFFSPLLINIPLSHEKYEEFQQ